MRVLVSTIVALNPGDAAILRGTVRLLQQAFGESVEIVAVDRQADAATALYPWMRFLPSLFASRQRGWIGGAIARLGYEHRLWRFDAWRLRWAGRLMQRGWHSFAALFATAGERDVLAEYLRADLVVASGGTYLVPAYDTEPPLRDYELTLALDRPLAFMPQSMGPFTNTRLLKRFADVFGRSRFVFVRDEQSRQHLQSLGVPAVRVRIVPDAAFALATLPSVMAAPMAPTVAPTTPPVRRVAISVREWKHFADGSGNGGEERYFAGVAALANWLVTTHDVEVTFLSSCQGIPDYWTDDAATARRVVARLDSAVAARVTIDGVFRDPEALQATLGTFDLVVATRMHVAILALCAGCPVLPIAYEFKTTELFKRLRLAWLPVPIEEATADGLIGRAERLLREWPAVCETLAAGVHDLSDEVRSAAAVIRDFRQSPAGTEPAP